MAAFAGPTITNVLVTATTSNSATIQWTTSTPSTTQLAYGTDPSIPYTNNAVATPVTSHTMTLPLLTAGPLYYVAAISTDATGPTQAPSITFSLCGAPGLTPVNGAVNNYYQYGSFTLTWIPPTGTSQSPTICGQAVTQTVTGSLDGGASFNTQIADASKIVPGPGKWQVSVTDAGNLAPITITSYLSQQSQNVSTQLQAAAASAGLAACITNTLTSTVFPSTCGGGGGGGSPGGTVGALQYKAGSASFGGLNGTGIPKLNGANPPTIAQGSTNGTGDYQLPVNQACSNGVSCSLGNVAGVPTWSFVASGSAGTGNVNNGNAYQVGSYPAAGNTIGGATNFYVLQPSMSITQINTLFSGLTQGQDMVFIPPSIGLIGFNNPNHVSTKDLVPGADYLQIAGEGVACDYQHVFVTLTQGSNLVSVGSLIGAPQDIGKMMTFATRTGYGYQAAQYSWEAKITAYTYPNFTLSAPAPFAFTGFSQLGTDNYANLQSAMDFWGYTLPMLFPSNCGGELLSQPLQWDKAQSFLGQQMAIGGLVGPPGQDVIQQPDSFAGSATGSGVRFENMHVTVDPGVDPTQPNWTAYDQNGTGTLQSVMYRPLLLHSEDANNPCADDWITNCSNGVANITQNSAVICVPTALGRTPPVGEAIIWPYFPAGIFKSTVASTAGSCSTGLTPITMSAAFPNTSAYTATQAVWFAGTAIQSTTTTIPTTMTYPLTLTGLSLPTIPDYTGESNMATHGTIKICGIEAEYLGTTPTSIILRRGPPASPGCTGTTVIAPVNMCPARNLIGSTSDQPWPVTPTINAASITNWSITGNVATFTATNGFYVGLTGYLNGFQNAASFFNFNKVTVLSAGLSGTQFEVAFTHADATSVSNDMTGNFYQATPAEADYFPGQCGGPAGISFPQSNALLVNHPGLVNATVENVVYDTTGVQGMNGSMAIYGAGNAGGFYGVDLGFQKVNQLMFGVMQGPAAAGNHGVSLVGPTGQGNTIHNMTIRAAYAMSLVDLQGTDINGLDFYSTEFSPFDGSAIGVSTCGHLGYTLDEETGGLVTNTSNDHLKTGSCEPENGSHAEESVYWESDCFLCSYDGYSFEGAWTEMGSGQQTIKNSLMSVPWVDYGTANHYVNDSGITNTYITNTWASTFVNWGRLTDCSASNGNGPLVNCSSGQVQPYSGHSIEAAANGNAASLHPEENMLGGIIHQAEWNLAGNLDVSPMQSNSVPDATEPYWGMYAGCNLGGGAACRISAWDNFNGFIYIGPHNRIVDGPYMLEANLKTASAASSLTMYVAAFDSGSGQCASPGIITTPGITTTTSWQHVSVPVDFTGKAGCVLTVQFYNGTTTDQLRVGEFDFVPIPQRALIPAKTFSTGAACSPNGSILGMDTTYTYACPAGVVVGIPYTGSGGSVAFASLVGGTNSTAAMVVGTGASLVTSGSGSITATAVPFSGVSAGTNARALLIGTGGSLAASGSGAITATSMPYSGLTGSVPTWNQNTTGTAGGLTGSPAITVSNVTDGALTPGNCLQAGAGGLLTTTLGACGSGGGGGSVTIQTNGTGNATQTTLNFVNTASVLFTNPSGGIESATVPAATISALGVSSPDNTSLAVSAGAYSIKSPGANTVLGFNASNAYTGFTLGTGLAFSGSQIVLSGSYLTGTSLSSPCIPKATGATTLACSLLSDNGTTLSYSGTGGFALTSSLPGFMKLVAGTGSIPSLAAGTGGFAAPVSGGTPYLFKLPATVTQGFILANTPAIADGVNESAWTTQHMEFPLSTGVGTWGEFGAGVPLVSYTAANSGHITALTIVYGGSACGGTPVGPTVGVYVGATLGFTVTGSTSANAIGTTTTVTGSQAYSAGNVITIGTNTAGNCVGYYNATATLVEP